MLSPILFTVHTDDSFELPKVLLLRAVVIAVLAVAAARVLASRARPAELLAALREAMRDPIALGVAALFCAALLSSAFSESPRTSLFGERTSFAGVTTLACYAVLFFATRGAASSPSMRCALLWAVLAGGIGASAYAVAQRAGLDPLPGTRPDWDPRRVWGTLGNPTFLADHLVAVLPVALYLSMRAWRRGWRGAACAVAVGAALIGSAAVFTFSRSGALALAVSIPALALAWRHVGERGAARALAIGCAAIGVIALVATAAPRGDAPPAWERITRIPDWRQEGRIEIWRAAARMFADHPWTGVGTDAFHIAFPAYRTVRYWEIEWGQTPTRAHNEPLHAAATQGVAGVAALVLLCGGLVVALQRALHRAPAADDRARIAALAAALLAIAVRSLFGLTVAAQGVVVATYAGLVSAEARAAGPESTPRGVQIGRVLAAAALIAWLAFAESIVAWGPRPALLAAVVESALWLLAPLLAVALCAARVERPAPADSPRARTSPLEIALWPAAVLALYYAVWLPLTADALCRSAWNRLARGGLEGATLQLRQAVYVAPSSDYYWRQLGLLQEWRAEGTAKRALRLELLRSARSAHERAAALVPASPRYRAEAARAVAALALHPDSGIAAAEALAIYRDAIARDRLNPMVWNDAARAALRLHEIDAAEEFARESLALHPREGEPIALLGRAALERGDRARAERELVAATNAQWRGRHSAEVSAWEDLARVRTALGRLDDAVAAWREVLHRDPENAEAHRQVLRLQTDGGA